MADKETTIFVVDQSPSMEEEMSNSILYMYDIIASKILRGRKQDKVGVITYHSTETDNPLETIEPGQWSNCKIEIEPCVMDWSQIVNLKRSVAVNDEPVSESEVDLPRAIAVALQYADEQTTPIRPSSKNVGDVPKEKISIIILSNCRTECSFEGLESPIVSLGRKLNAMIHVVIMNSSESEFNEELKVNPNFDENIKSLTSIVGSLQEVDEDWPKSVRTRGSSIFYYKEAQTFSKDIRVEPIRLVKPTKVFDGELRLGCHINNIETQEAGLYRFVQYDRHGDQDAIVMRAEGYPCIKVEDPITAHYRGLVKNSETGKSEVVSIKFQRDHVVKMEKEGTTKDTPDEERYDIQSVPDDSLIKGYKYGYSVIPFTEALDNTMKFPSFPGIDIISFNKKWEVPPWYYQNESVVIMCHSAGRIRDKLSFSLLAQSLLKSNMVAVVRYVQKRNSPIKLAVLTPVKLQTEDSKTRPDDKQDEENNPKREYDDMENDEDNREIYAFTISKIPFKEDEKIPNLPIISGIYGTDEHAKRETHPTEEMVDLMDKLIDSMDFDNLSSQAKARNPSKESEYLELNDFDTALPIPRRKGIEFQSIGKKTFSDVTRRLLSVNSPRLHILNRLLRDIAIHFAAEADPEKASSLNDLIFEDIEKQKSGDESGKTRIDTIIENIVVGENYDQDTGDNLFIPQIVEVNEEMKSQTKKIVSAVLELFDVQYVAPEERVPRRRVRSDESKQEEPDNGPSVEEILNM